MTSLTRRATLAGASLLLVLAGLALQLVAPAASSDDAGRAGRFGRYVAPATAEAAQTTRLKASPYGPAIYYRTSPSGDWRRFKRGTSRSFDSNDAVKSSGRSFAIIRSLYRVDCVNQPPNKPQGLPVNEDDGTLQAYPKPDCKN